MFCPFRSSSFLSLLSLCEVRRRHEDPSDRIDTPRPFFLRRICFRGKMKGMSKLSAHLRPFLEHVEVEKGRSHLTVRNYSFYLERFIEWAKDPNAADITLDMIHNYRLFLNRLASGEGDHTLKKNTQNYHLIALRSFLKFLMKRDVKTLTPEKIELAKQGTREVAFLEQEDLERLLAAPEATDASPIVQARDKAILEIFFSTGLRVSELASLRREQVNGTREELSVRGKGDKLRLVFMSPKARVALKAYLDMRDTDEVPYVFVRHDRAKGGAREIGALTPRSIERLVQHYAIAAGIPKAVTPHTLRHSFATDLLINGADLRSVQTLLGHSSITTTQIYTHVTNRQLKDVFTAFHDKQRE